MADIPLTPAQEAEAQRLYQAFQQAFLDEARQTARLLASKDDRHLLGQTEFEVREAVHRLGAKAIATALEQRKKGGTAVRARPAPTVTATPAASAGVPRASSACSGRCGSAATTITAAAAIGVSAPGTNSSV